MSLPARTAEKDTDVRITPSELWQSVLELAGQRLICDVCTEPNNPLKAARFFTEKTNGLTSPWARTASDIWRFFYFGNVPYSHGQVQRWAEKFTREARGYGLECLMLTQADVSTGWYAYLRDNADARCHLSKRVVFLEPDGEGGYRKCEGGAKFGSQLSYWGPRRRRFARIFGALGEVIHGLGPAEEG